MKFLLALAVLTFLLALLFPRSIEGVFRRAGRATRSMRDLGREVLTLEEAEDSPLARYEVKAGEVVALRVLAEQATCRDPALGEAVVSVGARLAAHARRKRIPYRFTVLESAEPNAFAVPGGSIFITRPLLALCEGRGELLAGVLGHEIAHVDQAHAIRSLAARTAARVGVNVLTLGRGAILGKLSTGMQELLTQGYRQDQELEADLVGARLAEAAGYDPRGLGRLLEKLAELETSRSGAPEGTLAAVLGYFRSHPPLSVRLAKLRAVWPPDATTGESGAPAGAAGV